MKEQEQWKEDLKSYRDWIRSKELSINELALLMVYFAYRNAKTGESFPSVETIIETMGLSPSSTKTYYTARRKLIEKGVIEVRHNKRAYYKILPYVVPELRSSVTNESTDLPTLVQEPTIVSPGYPGESTDTPKQKLKYKNKQKLQQSVADTDISNSLAEEKRETSILTLEFLEQNIDKIIESDLEDIITQWSESCKAVKYGTAQKDYYPDHREPWRKLMKATKKPDVLHKIFKLAKELHHGKDNTPQDTESLWTLYDKLSRKLLPEVPPEVDESVILQNEREEAAKEWQKEWEKVFGEEFANIG